MAQPPVVLSSAVPLTLNVAAGAVGYVRPTNVQGGPGTAPPLDELAVSPMTVSQALPAGVDPATRFYSTVNDMTVNEASEATTPIVHTA